MKIEEHLNQELIDKIENPELKKYIEDVKTSIINKETIDPSKFLETAIGMMNGEENSVNIKKLRDLNENTRKAMEHIKNIKI